MSTPQLDSTIAALEEEISRLGAPPEGSSLWWMLRAKSTGLSLLRTLRQRGITDPAMADAFRKDLRSSLVHDVMA